LHLNSREVDRAKIRPTMLPAWLPCRHGPRQSVEGRWGPVARRAYDLVLGIALLVLALMVVIAVAIRLDTPGRPCFARRDVPLIPCGGNAAGAAATG
jgi:hypothetical protein